MMDHEELLALTAARLNLVCELLDNQVEPEVNNVVRLARTQLIVALFGDYHTNTVAERMQYDLDMTFADAIKAVNYLLDSCLPYDKGQTNG